MATIMDILEQNSQFSQLARAFAIAKLDVVLRGEGSFTLFAPTNEAVFALPEKHLAIMQGDLPKLPKILKFHLLPTQMGAAALIDHRFLKTLEGQRLHFTSHLDNIGYAETTATDAYGYVMGGTITMAIVQTLKVNGAAIIRPNIPAANGVIHMTDRVLIPWLLDFTR